MTFRVGLLSFIFSHSGVGARSLSGPVPTRIFYVILCPEMFSCHLYLCTCIPLYSSFVAQKETISRTKNIIEWINIYKTREFSEYLQKPNIPESRRRSKTARQQLKVTMAGARAKSSSHKISWVSILRRCCVHCCVLFTHARLFTIHATRPWPYVERNCYWLLCNRYISMATWKVKIVGWIARVVVEQAKRRAQNEIISHWNDVI